jgi:hypothetical protein
MAPSSNIKPAGVSDLERRPGYLVKSTRSSALYWAGPLLEDTAVLVFTLQKTRQYAKLISAVR